MNEVAELNTRFGGKDFCPTNEEIDLCCDHALEVEQRSPANPVDQSLFTDDRWKAMQKARGPMAERLTGDKNGTLCMDPSTMEQQLVLFEKEVLELGLPVQGKESCQILQGMLTDKHRAVLQHTN